MRPTYCRLVDVYGSKREDHARPPESSSLSGSEIRNLRLFVLYQLLYVELVWWWWWWWTARVRAVSCICTRILGVFCKYYRGQRFQYLVCEEDTRCEAKLDVGFGRGRLLWWQWLKECQSLLPSVDPAA